MSESRQPRGPRGRNMGPRPKVDHPMQTLGRVLRLMMKHYKFRMLLVFLCIVIAAATQLYGLLFIRTLIDDYIKPLSQSASPDFSGLAFALVRLGLLYLAEVFASYARAMLMLRIAQGTLLKLRQNMFDHMETLPIRYFDTHAHGDIMSVYTNDVDTLRMLMSNTIPETISTVINVAATFVSMLILSIPMTLMTLLMIGVISLVTMKLGSRSAGYFVQNQKNLGALNGFIEEMMEGQKVVKVFCHEQRSIEDFEKKNEELRKSANNANGIANILMPINNNLAHLSYVLCAVVGALIAINGKGSVLTIGTIVSFLTLNRNFTRPISQLSSQINNVVMGMAGAQRVFEIIDTPSEVDEGDITLVNMEKAEDGSLVEADHRTEYWAWKSKDDAGNTTYTPMLGDVVFKDVDFGYVPEKTVLHNINLYATPGQKIAFVGSTGAGKTTITNLLNRFYDIEKGDIIYDGAPIRKYRKYDLRRSLGIVLQETNLFTGTVMENIRYGRLTATDEDCIEAAKLANADGFVRRLPEGYDTMLTGNGSNLSQGQRQLLSIARAVVLDPPVLILDEATSSVDTHTEYLIQQGMDELMKGRTTFVIAHRLSTVMNADCIMVLEKGVIIERGSHEQLLEEKGKYYQLYTGNFAEE